MGIGVDHDGHPGLERQFQKRPARILRSSTIAQPGGIDFHHGAGPRKRLNGRFVESPEVAGRHMAEFFHQIRMSDEVEKS